MEDTKTMIEVPTLISRIERLQNSSKNLNWGHHKNEDDLWILCCGHNYYNKTLTLTVRIENPLFYTVRSDNCKGDYKFLCYGNEDEVIHWIIEHLKEIYPEIRS